MHLPTPLSSSLPLTFLSQYTRFQKSDDLDQARYFILTSVNEGESLGGWGGEKYLRCRGKTSASGRAVPGEWGGKKFKKNFVAFRTFGTRVGNVPRTCWGDRFGDGHGCIRLRGGGVCELGEGGRILNWEMCWKNGGMIWKEWAAGFGLVVVFRGFWEGFFLLELLCLL
jgi:hypothetical protein